MQIESIKLKNFRAFKDTEWKNIPRFAMIVGANGSGKSTLFKLFEFLRDAMKDNITVALSKLGGNKGFEEVRSRNSTGPIEIEIKFREREKSPRITYKICIDIDNKTGKAIIIREVLQYRRAQRGAPWKFIDFSNGKGEAATNEISILEKKDFAVKDLQREYQEVKSSDILAIKGLSQFSKFPAVKALGDLIESWHISDFHISKARSEQEVNFAEHLSREGENLSLVIDYLYKNHREIFDKILNQIKHRIPGISSVESKVTEEGKVLLKFQDSSFTEPFLARYVSDGTIKMLAYLILLYDPIPHSLLCVEEPENQLYPSLLAELVEEFRSYSCKGGQVLVSTHSPDILNACRLGEVYWIVKENGYSKICKAQDNEQIKSFMDEGDKLGYLWKQGFFEKVDPK